MQRRTAKEEPAARTREGILRLLLKEPRTVERLATELGVTKNAVRAQLVLLQQEGAVEIRGTVKGTRRPSVVYGTRASADVQYSRAYPAVLTHLVKVLANRSEPRRFGSLMRDLGRDIADSAAPLSGTPRQRIEGAVGFLRSLGSPAEVIKGDGHVLIASNGCLLAQVVAEEPRTCKAMESLLHNLTGLPVTERCDHTAHPSCRFEFTLKPEELEKFKSARRNP
ncbi:MAG: ArsR family transcriptional regulator [Nitrospiraceae bacterium]|nr:ArsR family transcriptional regulator [Nitrospiraceae bacterium]